MSNNMYNIFDIGDEIYGFCNGFFGRDDYNHKTCVLVRTKYAVFEYDDGEATVLNYDSILKQYFDEGKTDKWKKPENLE